MGRGRSGSRGSSGRRGSSRDRGGSSKGGGGKGGGGGGGGHRSRRHNEGDLFEAHWLNECLNEARGLRRMRKIEHGVSDFLADHLRGQLDSQHRQQALFSLLGFGFVQRHFPHHRYDPRALDSLEDGRRKEVEAEAKEFLEEKMRLGLDHFRSNNEVDRKLMMDLREIFSSDFQVGERFSDRGEHNWWHTTIFLTLLKETKFTTTIFVMHQSFFLAPS